MNGKPWDKFVLVGAGVIVIALSALFITKALSFGDRFVVAEASPDDTIPETGVRIVNIATQFVESTNRWTTDVTSDGSGKPIPLFVSIPIVELDGDLIDMLDPNARSLRPPVTNRWLLENNLDYLNAGVLAQDPDDDGFTTLAEWEAKTDPSDSAAHPPYADKLVMHSRRQQEYILRFAARPDSERFQIMRLPSAKWPRRDNFYLRVGETSGDDQFRVEGFEEKRARNNVGIEVDASVVKITYLPTGQTFELVRNVDEIIPTYFAELEFILDPGNKFFVKEGDAFNIVLDPETKYRATKVNEASTIVTYQTGTEPEQTVEIPQK